MKWTFTDSMISMMVLSNIPSGTTIKYTSPVSGPVTWVSSGVSDMHPLPGDDGDGFRTVVDTLTILSAAQVVQERADAPVFLANNLTVVENLEGGFDSSPLFINVNGSVDSERDDSEVVSVVITVPSD
jgi:hypothetical protein